jgi:hypothetical protein
MKLDFAEPDPHHGKAFETEDTAPAGVAELADAPA